MRGDIIKSYSYILGPQRKKRDKSGQKNYFKNESLKIT